MNRAGAGKEHGKSRTQVEAGQEQGRSRTGAGQEQARNRAGAKLSYDIIGN